MSSPLILSFSYRRDGTRVRTIGICPSVGFQNSSIIEPALSRYLRKERLPEHVVVFSSDADRDRMHDIFRDDDVSSRLSGLTGAPQIVPVVFDSSTNKTHVCAANDWKSRIAGDEIVEELRQASLQTLFTDLGGMLHGSDAHHYVKPSNKHSDRFIRTANVLNTADAVNLVGLWLAEHVRPDTKFIYCDTSSIGTVAYQALIHRFGGGLAVQNATVDSFGSYEGIDSYDFRDPKHSLVVVSASTSGDLVQKLLRNKGFPADRLVTLFYLGSNVPPGITLCNLTRDSHTNPAGFAPIQSYSTEDCPFCARNSLATTIVGDQFLTERPKISSHTIRQSDAPQWLRGLMEEVSRTSIFLINRHDVSIGRPAMIEIDLSPLLADDKSAPEAFSKDLRRAAEKSIPVSTRYVIHKNSPGSRALATYFSTLIEEAIGVKPILIHSGELAQRINELGAGGILVVADYVSDSRDLMNVNRILRTRSDDRAVVYFVGFAAHESDAAFREMRSNLTFGDGRAMRFGFDYVRSCFLPSNPERSPWDFELTLLADMEQWCGQESREFPKFLSDRMLLLRESTSSGMTDGLFLKSLKTQSDLKLRKDFALFDSNTGPDLIRQSTVYVTITAVLHELRQPHNGVAPLHNEYYRRTLLSPSNFDRFNDGIIQASILRAAYASELCYSQDIAMSRSAADIIVTALTSWQTAQGEASLEFLLAICLRRLQLCADDLAQVVKVAQQIKDPQGVFDTFASFMRARTQ